MDYIMSLNLPLSKVALQEDEEANEVVKDEEIEAEVELMVNNLDLQRLLRESQFNDILSNEEYQALQEEVSAEFSGAQSKTSNK